MAHELTHTVQQGAVGRKANEKPKSVYLAPRKNKGKFRLPRYRGPGGSKTWSKEQEVYVGKVTRRIERENREINRKISEILSKTHPRDIETSMDLDKAVIMWQALSKVADISSKDYSDMMSSLSSQKELLNSSIEELDTWYMPPTYTPCARECGLGGEIFNYARAQIVWNNRKNDVIYPIVEDIIQAVTKQGQNKDQYMEQIFIRRSETPIASESGPIHLQYGLTPHEMVLIRLLVEKQLVEEKMKILKQLMKKHEPNPEESGKTEGEAKP